jgi:hypothetical protein
LRLEKVKKREKGAIKQKTSQKVLPYSEKCVLLKCEKQAAPVVAHVKTVRNLPFLSNELS